MAQRSQTFPENAPGPLFVDRTCIDCGTCYEFLPAVFRDACEHSLVHRQPETPAERHRALMALMALMACPTASIGTTDKTGLPEALAAFPDPIQDDVAGHAAIHRRLGCRRVLHREDMEGPTAALEWPVEGTEPVALAPDLLFIPTPGHTAGSACLLYRETFLFTGDSLWWNPGLACLYASSSYCWHDWPTQLRSLERLLEHRFTWVLPGHGHGHRAESPEAMREELSRGLERLGRVRGHLKT